MKTSSFLSSLLSLIFIIKTNLFPSVKLSEATYNTFRYPENYNQIELPKVDGPESFAFDCHGNGPYASVSDGRILKWQGPNLGWKEFATTSPNRQDFFPYIAIYMCR
ncbi:hypothetical protein TIFTF001_008128 [Ficus carica]|uniref:Uncharacterized protein n=1 Tax=Ficus carica TaxID=3494 RepID=A0AA88A482_FICCA|nr:hypothetical protein TIFTF001_008128 [Ficus carica]